MSLLNESARPEWGRQSQLQTASTRQRPSTERPVKPPKSLTKNPGRTPFLTEAQMAELRQLVEDGPDLATDKVVRWRIADLQGAVKRRFSVNVHQSTVGKWLHQLRLTQLQPRPVHPKKDPAAKATFKKTSPA
jgi:transposase